MTLSWRSPPRPSRRGGLVIAVVLALAPTSGLLVLLRSEQKGPVAVVDRASSLATITERTITSQQLVGGLLGFAGATKVLQPVGTPPDGVAQADLKASTAEQTLLQARAEVSASEATLAADARTLASDQAKLAADRQKEISHCSAAGTAGLLAGTGPDASASGLTPCDTDRQAVAAAQKQVDVGAQKLSADHKALAQAGASVISAELSSAAARQAMSDAHRSALAFGPTSTYTALPTIGRVVIRGQPLYSISVTSGAAAVWVRPCVAGVPLGHG